MSRVRDIVDEASRQLNDTARERWSILDLLVWLNEAQTATVIYRPDASVKRAAQQLVEGIAQTITDPVAIKALRAINNAGTDGTAFGPAITRVEMDDLNAIDPNWPADVGQDVENIMFDEQDPLSFYVYPGQPVVSQNFINLKYSVTPANDELDRVEGKLADKDPAISAIYDPALISYILYKAHAKHSEHASNANMAANHYQAFLGLLGIKTKVDRNFSPVNNAPPNFNPNARKATRTLEE